MTPLQALATLHRRGGLTVCTPAEGPPALRTVLQRGGDLVSHARPDVSEAQVDEHLAALAAQLEVLKKARNRILGAATATATGGLVLAAGLNLDGEPGTWLSWLGGGACALPAGATAVGIVRVWRWLKGRGAFGPPRGQDEAPGSTP